MRKVTHQKNIVEVKNVFFSYGAEDVLEDITFEIHEGDYVGVIGPNGAGKTTLLKILLGLLRPREGVVKLFGSEVAKFKQWSKIGYVPQKATSFDVNFPATVWEVVLMGRYARKGLFHGITSKDKTIVKNALLQVEMWDYKDRLIGDLSGGQEQRVFIARALAGEPEIIFLDEPTAGVDQKTQEEFYALLQKLNNKLNLTLILISHDIEMVTKEAMHIICIDHALTCHLSAKEFLKESKSANISGHEVKIMNHHHHH